MQDSGGEGFGGTRVGGGMMYCRICYKELMPEELEGHTAYSFFRDLCDDCADEIAWDNYWDMKEMERWGE